MVKMQIVFDDRQVKAHGYTTQELMDMIRKKCKESGAVEISEGIFVNEGIHALCDFTRIVGGITEEKQWFIDLLKQWTIEADGEIEDCILATRRWYQKKGIKIAMGI